MKILKKIDMRAVLAIIAILLTAVGAGLYYLPAGLITAGVLLYIDTVVLTQMGRKENKS